MNNILKKGDYLDTLLRCPQTIFTTKEVALLWSETKSRAVTLRLDKYVRAGKLLRVRRGMYAKDNTYDEYELATKLFTPAYVSFETVLGLSGVTFQFYSQIFVASNLSREVVIDGQTYVYKKIKNSILTNRAGIEDKGAYFIASPERALLDVLYLNKDYYFDNLDRIDWKKVQDLLPMYNNKRMVAVVKKQQADAANR